MAFVEDGQECPSYLAPGQLIRARLLVVVTAFFFGGSPQDVVAQEAADAMRCLTTAPTWLSFEESAKGSLEKGKLADLVVLDWDYLTCPENEIARIKVAKTMLDGRFVYDRKD